MQCGLSEASTGTIHLGRPASQAVLVLKDDCLRRTSEESTLHPYLRRGCAGDEPSDSSASGAWALKSIQSGGLASVKPSPLEQTLRPSATNLSLILQAHDWRSDRVSTSYAANRCRSGGHHYQARRAAVADVCSLPIDAKNTNSSALFLPTHRQAPSLANG
jgi:hypothetical protein